MSDSSPIIKVRSVWKIFGQDVQQARSLADGGYSRKDILKQTGCTVALRNVSLDIPQGKTFAIMGLSGSGKSTLVRCLNRLIDPTEGSVVFDGFEVTTMPAEELRELRRKRVTMVFQSFGLLPHYTVAENVAFGLTLQKAEREVSERKVAEVLEQVGLAPWAAAYPDQLSGGMQQRVGLARALATDPDVLLMDEPFSALDPLMRSQMQDELLNLQASMQKTIVFITHDLDEALKLGSNIALLHDGEVAQVGSPTDILREPADDYVRRFVAQVDHSPVLLARDVMFTPGDLVRVGHAPMVALRLMESEGRSSVFVLSSDGRLAGLLTADAAAEAAVAGEATVANAVKPAPNIVTPDTPIADLVEMATTQQYPLAVVEDGEFQGVVARVSLLRALAYHRLRLDESNT